MIRRRHRNGFALITQDDHARLCAALARAWGNAAFPKPEPFPPFLAAVALHDAGWAHSDFSPTPNPDGLPPDIFDPPPADAESAERHQLALHAIWENSVRLAAVAGPWAQLLVSVHALTLSAYAAARVETRPQRFASNRFQHRQIELQERLRVSLGLSLDIPLTTGLADPDAAEEPGPPLPAAERRLIDHYRHLQTLDLLSLAVCCTDPPSDGSPPVGPEQVRLRWKRHGDDLRVEPWPFRVPEVKLSLPCVVMPRHPFASVQALAEAIASAAREVLTVRVIA